MQKKAYAKYQSGLQLPKLNYAIITKGLCLSFILSLALLSAVTILFFYSPLTENIAPYIIYGITLVSILLGSMYVGKRVEEKGWFRGGITGLLYVCTLSVLGLLLLTDHGAAGMTILYRFVIGFSFGALGGILGINT